MQNRLFDNKFNWLPDEIFKKYIVSYASPQDSLNLSASNKQMRKLVIEEIFNNNDKRQIKLKEKILISWFFNQDRLFDDKLFYIKQLRCFIKTEDLNFWHKIISYQLISSLSEPTSSSQEMVFLPILQIADNALIKHIENTRILLIQDYSFNNKSLSLLDHIVGFFFNEDIRPDYIQDALAQCLAFLVRTDIITQPQLRIIIKLGFKKLKQFDPRCKISAAILLSHLTVYLTQSEQDKMISILQKIFDNEIYYTKDRVHNIKILQLLNQFIIKLPEEKRKGIIDSIFKNISSNIGEIFSTSIEALDYFSSYLGEEKLIFLMENCFKHLNKNDIDREFSLACQQGLLLVSKQLENIFLTHISTLIEENKDIQIISYQHYKLAKILADCLSNNCSSDVYIQDVISHLQEGQNKFACELAIIILSQCHYLISDEKMPVIINQLLIYAINDDIYYAATAISTLGEIQSRVPNDKLDDIICCLLKLAERLDDSLVQSEAIFALKNYSQRMMCTQSIEVSSSLYTMLLNFLNLNNNFLFKCEAIMRTIANFSNVLTDKQKLMVASFFQEQLQQDEQEILLASIQGLKDFISMFSDQSVLEIVDVLLELKKSYDDDEEIINACYDAIILFLPKIKIQKVLDILSHACEELKKNPTEAYINFIEKCADFLQNHEATLYVEWQQLVTSYDSSKSNLHYHK